jgi:hypothetical protein
VGNSKSNGQGNKANTAKNDTTLLVLVVDRSGSMESIRTDMEGGIKVLLEQQAAEDGHCLVTLAQFDTDYELLYNAVPVAELGEYQLVPRGGTALLDAIGRTIGEVKERLAGVPKKKQPDLTSSSPWSRTGSRTRAWSGRGTRCSQP